MTMTADATTEDKKMYLQAGMNDYISKTVKVEQHVSILEDGSLKITKEEKVK